MKRSLIATALISACFISTGAFAADTATGTLTINGNIAASACTFEENANQINIDMATLPVSEFNSLAQYAAYTGLLGNAKNTVTIKCSPEAKVNLSLLSNIGLENNDTVIPSSNASMGYYLYLNNDNQPLEITKPIDITSYGENGIYTLPFKARYVPRVAGANVEAGSAVSTLVMSVTEN